MPILVEDGTGLEGSNAYVDEDTLSDYADDRAVTLADGDAEAALIRATTDLDAIYWSRFSGERLNGRDQGLEWPRTGATDVKGNAIDENEIPQEVKDATCEFAIRELANPGSVLADLERGGSIKSIQAGSVAIEYGANATNTTVFQLVNGIMAPLVGGGLGMSRFFGTSTRG